ncbi:hypothetical protein [Arenimonas composti]|uniref:Secreted protein n=1 Tax=Arenimonas composti TR7-09 = DSM 18010 TaxID=1121013 RepID=A0A091BI42_9GAMM|nr:hypothetical protein [Arenimonas composti]KFN51416.1 hypothetical protein P873_02815 [Arenimonas composti TR7-09 = DSM 18010]
MRSLLSLSVLLFAFAAGGASAQQFSSLEEKMSHAEFTAAGLDKLSPEELAALNAWIAQKVATAPATAAPAGEDRRGFLASSAGPGDAIVSSIDGEFRGWREKGDRIVLANGQIWEVTESTSRLVVRVQNPTVIIEPGMLGAWYLRIDGYNTRAKVVRIK